MAQLSADRIGLCLDVDGTLYRGGSVFVETLVHLPVAPRYAWTAADRERLRRAVGIVGAYQGRSWTAWRWRVTLRLVDEVRKIWGGDAATAVLRRLRGMQARLSEWAVTQQFSPQRSVEAYDVMRESLLETYGTAIAGHDRAALTPAVADLLTFLDPIDEETTMGLHDVGTAGVEIALVTDMPAHIAEPFAEVVLDVPVQAVVGTAFDTDTAGRFTGGFTAVEKQRAVADLREQYGWDHVIAVGDTRRDLAMRPLADQFVAVAGQGPIREELTAQCVVGDTTSPETLRTAEVVYLPRDQSLGTLLQVMVG